MGAATAYHLARRGQRVVLLERFALGHTRGSSHGDGRIIRYTYAEAEYVQMASLAYDGWAALQEESGTTLTSTTGGWECGPEGSVELAELESSFQRFDIPYERWDAAESARHFPHFRLPESSYALYQKDGGIVRAEKAVAAFWNQTRRHGAALEDGVQVTGIHPDGAGVTVSAADGRTWQAGSVVLACGGWLGPMAKTLGLDLPLTATRERVAYFLPRADSPVDHGLGGMPTVIDYHTPQPFYLLPQIDLPGVKLGWHHSGHTVQAETGASASETADADHDRHVAQEQEAYVSRRLPGLETSPHHVLHCLYTNTVDYNFLLDRHPEHPRVVLAGGFSGHGFKFAPVVGSLVADLVDGSKPPVDLGLFSLRRFEGETVVRRRGA